MRRYPLACGIAEKFLAGEIRPSLLRLCPRTLLSFLPAFQRTRSGSTFFVVVAPRAGSIPCLLTLPLRMRRSCVRRPGHSGADLLNRIIWKPSAIIRASAVTPKRYARNLAGQPVGRPVSNPVCKVQRRKPSWNCPVTILNIYRNLALYFLSVPLENRLRKCSSL